jgi:hypothetical protein
MTISSPPSRLRTARRARTLATIGVTAAGVFGILAMAVSRRQTAEIDEELLASVAPDDEEVRRAAEALHPFGKWWTYVPAAVVLAPIVAAASAGPLRRRAAGAGAIVLSSLIAAALNPAFDRWLPQPASPPGRRDRPKASFPSGHTFGLGSLTFTAGYILVREELLPAAVVIPLAISIPLASGGARLVEEKHWPSDIAGGALVALSIAALCLATFETVGATDAAFDAEFQDPAQDGRRARDDESRDHRAW